MTDKDPTARQRSAFSDAVEILNELHNEGVPHRKIIEAMEHSLREYGNATDYINAVYFAKWSEKKGTQND